MSDRELLDLPEYRALHPAARLVLLTLRMALPRRGWGTIVGRNGALAELTGMPVSRVEHAFEALVEAGLVHMDGHTIYLHPSVAKTPVPDPVPRRRPRAAKPQNKKEYSPEFEAAWADYPKRIGGNPKRGAYKAWCARIAEGAKPEELHAAVKRYAAYVERMVEERGEEARRYVMQAQTFFGPNERWKDDYEFGDDKDAQHHYFAYAAYGT